MIRAILYAQLLSLRSFRLASGRPSAVFAVITTAVWYGFWVFLAFAAYEYASDPDSPDRVAVGLSAGLMLVFIYWQFVPLLTASLGASLDLRKLLAYPIPHRKLFFVEVLLRLTTCVEMLLLTGGLAAGVLANPSFRGRAGVARVSAGAILFIVFNLLLAAGLRSIIERLLSRRRIRELMVFIMVMSFALPRFLMAAGAPMERFRAIFERFQTPLWPWSAAARMMLGAGVAAGLAVLAGWALLALVFARPQFERSLRFDFRAAESAPDSGAVPRRSLAGRFYAAMSRLAPDPIGAVVDKELRSLARTPRFRLVFIMGFTFGLVVWLPVIAGKRTGGEGIMGANFLVLVSLYALLLLGQVSYWNAFGFDRSAAQLWFSAPAPLWKALAGKNLAAGIFILLEMVAVTTASLLLRVKIPPAKILETFLVLPVAALYILGVGNLSSVHLPRPMNPERVSQGGSAGRFQGLLFLFYPIALLPVVLAYLARYAFQSEVAFWSVAGFAAALGAVFYWIAMDSAVSAALRRREQILAELAKGSGPVLND